MSDRRSEERGGTDRRDLRRPPLWLNALLTVSGALLLLFASRHRRHIDADYGREFASTAQNPSEVNQITAELAEMNLTQDKLARELERRLAYIESLKSREYYLSLDTTRKTLSLKSGNDTVQKASVQIFIPPALKGVFKITGRKAVAGGRVLSLLEGSFVVSETDYRGIQDRITPATRVYVF